MLYKHFTEKTSRIARINNNKCRGKRKKYHNIRRNGKKRTYMYLLRYRNKYSSRLIVLKEGGIVECTDIKKEIPRKPFVGLLGIYLLLCFRHTR